MGNLTAIEQLDDSDEAGFEQVWHIFQESIVGSERKTRAQLRRMLDRPDYRFIVARERGVIAGFAIIYISANEPVNLLEYLAVAPSLRGGGVGSRLFRAAAHELGQRAMLIEVDTARPGQQDFEQCALRQRFYRKLGCLKVQALPYILPLPGAPPVMDLMVYRHAWPASLTHEELRRWLEEIYCVVYACASDDHRIDRMLAGAAESLRLR